MIPVLIFASGVAKVDVALTPVPKISVEVTLLNEAPTPVIEVIIPTLIHAVISVWPAPGLPNPPIYFVRIAVTIPEVMHASVDTPRMLVCKLFPRNSVAVMIPALQSRFPTCKVPPTVLIPLNVELNEFSKVTVAFVNVAA